LSVVPLKIGNNHCKPGETYRKTPSLCKIPTLDRANLAEDRHQHSRGGLSIVLGRKIPKLLILNDISSISQDEDLFDTVFRWPKSAKNGIFDEFSQNLRFLKIGEYH